MFTGIVETTGTIAEIRAVPGGRRLRVAAAAIARESALGSSISVGGVCLTVAGIAGDALDFDVIPETLSRTTLGRKRVGDRVNLERSLRVGDRLDGHFVQGHVDGTAVVERVRSTPEEYVLRFLPESSLRPYLVPKGAVTLDGVSLTIASVDAEAFTVAFIPTTLARTTVSSLRAGDTVNVETDILARTVVHRLAELAGAEGLTMASLREAGFA